MPRTAVAIDFQPLDPRAHVELCAAAGEPSAGALPDFAQRYAGDEDFVGLARGHEPIDEDLSRRRYRNVIERVAQGAFQHHGPEPPHGVFRLLLAAEPLAHGGRVGRVGLAMTGQSQHGPADGPALAAREITEPPQSGHEVQRSRQPAAGGEVVTPAVGAEEMQRRVAIEAVGGFRAAAEIQQVRAAAHGHVRRKIDELIDLHIVIRPGPAAQCRGLLEQFDVETLLHRRHGRRQSGHAAADDGEGRFVGAMGWSAEVHWFQHAEIRMIEAETNSKDG